MAIVIGTLTENIYRTPYVELPSQRTIFPPQASQEEYRILSTYNATDNEHFEYFATLKNSFDSFANFFHSNVMHYGMVVAGAFNSLQSQAPTMPSWKVQEASNHIGSYTSEIGYFVAASLSQNDVPKHQVIIEAVSFVGSYGLHLGVPMWAQVSSEYVYKGALQFLEDKDAGDEPNITLPSDVENLEDISDDVDLDVYKDIAKLLGDDDETPELT